MASLPALPHRTDGTQWSPNVYNAYQIISDLVRNASQALHQEDSEVQRLSFHVESLINGCVPILEALEASANVEGLSIPWIHSCAELVGHLLLSLTQARGRAVQSEQQHVGSAEPVFIVKTRKPGRPCKVPDLTYLQEAMSPKRRITLSCLARVLGIHRHTLRYYLKQNKVDYKFSKLSDADLDKLVRAFRSTRPDLGLRTLVGFLRSHHLRVQKRRVVGSIHRIDRIGNMLRHQSTIRRRKYNVARPNALWHMDGHHKLILWGIVIHGFVDGYSRLVTGLRASTNNRASTVLSVFLEAVQAHGMPSRIRGDRGGENKDVSVFIIMANGPNRGSFLWGSSTHNTRIERLWVEVGAHFVRQWRAFFYRLERLHDLDRTNPQHLWLIHHLFLAMINEDCTTFQEQWNAHPISGEGRDRSPNDLFLLGQTQHGVYLDDCDGVHPDIIQEYYGIHGQEFIRASGQTGAGHSDEEDVWEELGERVAAAQEANFHDAVDVPAHNDPFTAPEHRQAFDDALDLAIRSNVLPAGYGLLRDEWEEDEYPTFEIIWSGRRGGKELRVALPDFVWRPRAELWGQALDILNRITYLTENDN